MRNEQNISQLMLKDHERLINLFNDFKSIKDTDRKQALKLFSRFDNELSGHFKLEESLIKSSFDNIRKEDGTLLPIATSLRLEHKKILGTLSRISESIRKNEASVDTSDLFLILRHHKNVEERLFYPELDKVLSEKDKSKIFESIKK